MLPDILSFHVLIFDSSYIVFLDPKPFDKSKYDERRQQIKNEKLFEKEHLECVHEVRVKVFLDVIYALSVSHKSESISRFEGESFC
jgi:hypothetical protein